MADITASTERTSVLPKAAFPFFNPATGQLEHLLGERLSSGGGGTSLPVSGGLYFGGSLNTAPVVHRLTGSAITSRVFTMTATVVVPPKSRVKAAGIGIMGMSAGNPASSLNSSITVGIRGTAGGYGGTAAGDLLVKVITSGGADLDMVVPGFCDAYEGQTVRLDLTRGVTAADFPIKFYVNRVFAVGASGSGNDWGGNLGTDPYFFYGCQSAARPWVGKILQAGVCSLDYSAAALLAFSVPTPEQLRGVAWGSFISNRDQDCAAYSGFTWDNWSQDGAAFTENGGGTRTPAAGNSTSWAHGEVNGVTAPGKLRLTAKATAGMNAAQKSGGTRGYAYRVKLKARLVSGTPIPLYFGFGHNVSNASQDTNAGEALIFTPGNVEQTFEAYVVARSTSVITLAAVSNADSAGQVFEFDDFTAERDSWVWADMDYGDGFAVPCVSNPAWDGVIPAGSGIQWASPKRNVGSRLRLPADQSVSSSTALADSALSFRVAAGAVYAFDFAVPFTLGGTGSGYKFNLTAPAGAAGLTSATVLDSVGNTVNEVQVTDGFPVLVSGALASAGTHQLRITGTIENGATEGLLTLQVAQLVSDAAAITLKKYGSALFTRTV